MLCTLKKRKEKGKVKLQLDCIKIRPAPYYLLQTRLKKTGLEDENVQQQHTCMRKNLAFPF